MFKLGRVDWLNALCLSHPKTSQRHFFAISGVGGSFFPVGKPSDVFGGWGLAGGKTILQTHRPALTSV